MLCFENREPKLIGLLQFRTIRKLNKVKIGNILKLKYYLVH